ncbi:MAG: FtsX-like permease family protein [Rikenellaceae bacterium]
MIRIATLSVAISVAVMIIAINIIVGFKSEITSKVVGFASHFKVVALDNRSGAPIDGDLAYVDSLRAMSFVRSVMPFTAKGGVMKTDEGIKGVVLKGVDGSYDMEFFKENLVEGAVPLFSDSIKSKEILISKTLASEMNLKLGDKFEMMFISGENVFRDRLSVGGVFQTSLAEFDGTMIIGDIRVANRVSGFKDNEVTGFEIVTDDLASIGKYLDPLEQIVFDNVPDEQPTMVVPITEEYIRIFDWLNLQDMNIWVVMIIMIFVAAFNMIAMMLIILIDKSSMIGIFKAIGMRNADLQRVFLYRSMYIVITGVVIGVVIGLGLSLIQLHFKILTLSSEAYFLSYVPIKINYLYICSVAVISFVSLILLQVVPVKIISKMSPHKSIKFN